MMVCHYFILCLTSECKGGELMLKYCQGFISKANLWAVIYQTRDIFLPAKQKEAYS